MQRLTVLAYLFSADSRLKRKERVNDPNNQKDEYSTCGLRLHYVHE
jgi:hypothetical protein